MSIWIWHAETGVFSPWTWWTAAFVHLSASHALVNLVALLCLLALGRLWGLGRATVWAVLLAWPLTVASLALWPAVTHYAGLSGPLHALAAVLVVHRVAALWPHPLHQARGLTALALGLGLAVKLALEAAWRQPVAWDAAWGFHVVYAAHLNGALCGVLCALLLAPRR